MCLPTIPSSAMRYGAMRVGPNSGSRPESDSEGGKAQVLVFTSDAKLVRGNGKGSEGELPGVCRLGGGGSDFLLKMVASENSLRYLGKSIRTLSLLFPSPRRGGW